ncbi:MAG: twin-arginine translocase TatA/TatE family subunit [Actinobacteria bacterium]|nr:twin-arginine translocase TatA/TatE family subunit [Actinomycetota bacterium]
MAGFSSFGLPELLIILAIALVIFGPKKIPDLASSIGKAIRNFKEARKANAQIDAKAEAEINDPENL